MIGEEVAPDPELLVRHGEVVTKEAREEAEQRSVGVGHLHGMDATRTFRPEEHAARRVERLAPSCGLTSFGLTLLAKTAMTCRCARPRRVSKIAALRFRQLDVTHPQAHR